MGYAYGFHLEVRSSGEWLVPEDLADYPVTFPIRRCGCFVDFDHRDYRATLFWGTNSIFPLRPGLPPDRSPRSAFTIYLDSLADGGAEQRLHWAPAEDLMIDLWDQSTFLLRSSVSARYVSLFGDGQQPFPYKELLIAGLPEDDFDRLIGYCRDSWITDAPIDPTHNWQLPRLLQVSPGQYVHVTWRETISSLMGKETASAFKGLARYGPWQDLRVITTWS